MYRRHGNKLGLAFLGCDLFVTSAAWWEAYELRFSLWSAPEGIPPAAHVLGALPCLVVLAALAYRTAGLYDIHRLRRLPHELGVVLKATGLLFLLVIATTFYRRDLYESRGALALFATLLPVGLIVSRRILWSILRHLRGRGLNHSRAIIVGSGRPGRKLWRTMRRNRWTGLEPIGFVDDARGPVAGPLLGSLSELAAVVRSHDVDHVFVALPLSRYGELCRIYESLNDLLVEVQLVPDIPNLAGMRVRMLEVDRQCFLGLRENPHRGWPRLAKRGLDVALSLAAIVVFAPLMLLIAALVKLTSPGPVFYRQARTGHEGGSFEMLKFRSMRLDAESSSGPVWTTRDDDRCTPIGRVLRQYSLDELPQLFNVLRGEMSLVGPRPERRMFVERFCHSMPAYQQRHQVKSGMTGWAQINGWRGDTSIRRRLEHDLYYISNWSLWLDVKILWLTIWRGFRNPNAY